MHKQPPPPHTHTSPARLSRPTFCPFAPTCLHTSCPGLTSTGRSAAATRDCSPGSWSRSTGICGAQGRGTGRGAQGRDTRGGEGQGGCGAVGGGRGGWAGSWGAWGREMEVCGSAVLWAHKPMIAPPPSLHLPLPSHPHLNDQVCGDVHGNSVRGERGGIEGRRQVRSRCIGRWIRESTDWPFDTHQKRSKGV